MFLQKWKLYLSYENWHSLASKFGDLISLAHFSHNEVCPIVTAFGGKFYLVT